MAGIVVLCALFGFVTAHVALVALLLRLTGPGSKRRALVALFVPPLAPYYGFRHGLPGAAWAWIATLALYAALVGILRGSV